MKERDKRQECPDQKPKILRNTPSNEDGRISPGFPGSQAEQQPQDAGVNKPELHPPKERAFQEEQKKPRRPRTLSDEEKIFLANAYQEALRKQKPETGVEAERYLRHLFGEPKLDSLVLAELKEGFERRREERAKRAAQYKLRQERKRKQQKQ